ncbi:MAG: VacJ family lipoprotein [Proteobacteria bacterium]|jgi:phospholipid-binding lipoprotein MlaA|nr:VacJ family lipoprotein [Pseudomonadota bacterium]
MLLHFFYSLGGSFRWSIPFRRALVACTTAALLSCSSVAASQASDPWREANTTVFKWNDYFDQLVVKPTAFAYTTFLPRFMRQGISNFFSNVDDINVLANDILQLKFAAAAGDSGRLLVNSTVGVGGFLDVASSVGLRKNEEDFGQTLAAWGLGSGPYVMLPVFGASTVRDSFGLVIDTVFNPLQLIEDRSLRLGLFLLDETDSRSDVLALDELITGNRYLFIREAYLQRREYLINDGMLDEPFGDF